MGRAWKPISTRPHKVLKRLDQVSSVLEVVTQQIDEVGLAVDDIKQTLADLVQGEAGLSALLPPGNAKRPRPKRNSKLVSYATSVELKWGLRDAEARINGQTVHLSIKLGLLLEILLSGDSSSADTGAGWISRVELRSRLGEKTGELVVPHTLEGLLSRLRGELREQAGLEGLIHSERRRGVRLGLQKYLAGNA